MIGYRRRVHRLQILAVILAVAMVAAGWASWTKLRDRKWASAVVPVLVTLLFGALSALSLTVWAAQKGYERLTHEVSAAVITTTRLDQRRFHAQFDLPNGDSKIFELRGDSIYVDARIIKWDPRLNVLGLHTAYQLDRVGGRFNSIALEQTQPRTIHPLSTERKLDVFRWAEMLGDSAPLVDAQYGSATFAPVRNRERYDLRVSTSGLLLRPMPPAQ